jgi:hypothetical protein
MFSKNYQLEGLVMFDFFFRDYSRETNESFKIGAP